MRIQSLALMSCVLVSLPSHAVEKSGGDPEVGKAIYQTRCKACHGPTGQGNPAMVEASKGAMQDLASKEVQGRSDERLAKDITGGTEQKKPIKPLTEKQMKDVIAFVRTMANN